MLTQLFVVLHTVMIFKIALCKFCQPVNPNIQSQVYPPQTVSEGIFIQLQSANVRSRLLCSQSCSRYNDCNGIYYQNNGSATNCKLYSIHNAPGGGIITGNVLPSGRPVIPVKVNTMCSMGAPVHGAWSTWSAGTCSVSCGAGTKTDERFCNSPLPAYGGRDCQGSRQRQMQCHPGTCPVHGGWSSWTGVGSCSLTCGNGMETETRSCSNPEPSYGGDTCAGTSERQIPCNLGSCPAKVDGGWSTWTAVGSCSAPCGNGQISEERLCNNPSPANGGGICFGLSTQQVACNLGACATVVNGGWSAWTPAGPCSVSCDNGQKSEKRSCNNPLPSNGGVNCVGSTLQQVPCNLGNCPDLTDEAILYNDFEDLPRPRSYERGATVYTSDRQSWVLDSSGIGVGASFGFFANKCASNPSRCNSGATFSMWMKLRSMSALSLAQCVFTTGGHTRESLGFEIYVQNNLLVVRVRVPGTIYSKHVSVSNMNQWFHIAFTWSNSARVVELYLNKVRRVVSTTANSDTQTVDTLTEMLIGHYVRTTSSHSPLAFYLDNFAVFYRVLTSAEIQQLYNM